MQMSSEDLLSALRRDESLQEENGKGQLRADVGSTQTICEKKKMFCLCLFCVPERKQWWPLIYTNNTHKLAIYSKVNNTSKLFQTDPIVDTHPLQSQFSI